jgi:two-component system C4-dicarboxylate transport response regulator DctD
MITDAAIRHLQDHDWPGNVRELRHFARSFALGLDPSSVYAPAEATRRPLRERTQAFEMAAIRQALQHSGGDVQQTLDRLGIPRKTFYDKLARYGIVPSAYRRPRS